MEEPTNDIDTETLQAQIDLSMAYAQNLVASWLPGSGSLTQQSSSRAVEAEVELQALLRRPSRLGVGAPLPETPTPAQTRLVQKLEGGKRRARESENGTLAASSSSVNNKRECERGEEESDSAEESRVVAVRKRTRVDPFEAGGKKKKMKKVVVETAPAKDPKDVSIEEAPQAGAMGTVDAMTRPGQKKRKKKRKKPPPDDGQGVQGRVALEGEPVEEAWWTNHDAEAAQHAEPSGSVQSLFDEWDGLWKHQQNNMSGSPGSSHSSVPPCVDASPAMSRMSHKSPGMSPSTSTISVPSALTASAPAILNLTGPPPMATEKIEGSPHKKRRRKRKKKKRTADDGADNDPPGPP